MNNDTKSTKPTASANLMQLMSFTADKALELADANSILGDIIEIDGITIIPVSKISAGFAGGGANMVNAAQKKQNTPSGSGAKVTVTPLSFLVVANGKVELMNINAPEKAGKASVISKIVDMVKGMKKDKKAEEEVVVTEDTNDEEQ